MKIFNKALYIIFLFFLAISNFPLLANPEQEKAIEELLEPWKEVHGLLAAIKSQLPLLKGLKDINAVKLFGDAFIKENEAIIEKVKFNNSSEDQGLLYNLFVLFHVQMINHFKIIYPGVEFYRKVINVIAQNNEKTRVMLLCLRYIYLDFAIIPDNDQEKRNNLIYDALKQTINQNDVKNPKDLLSAIRSYCVATTVRLGKVVNLVAGEEDKKCPEGLRLEFAGLDVILKKLMDEFQDPKNAKSTKKKKKKKKKVSSVAKVLIQSQPISSGKREVGENGSKTISIQAATSEIVIPGPWSTLLKKVRAPFIKIQKEDPIISPDYEGPDVGPIDLPAEPPLKIDATFKFLSANTEKENIVLLHRLFTKLKEHRTAENSNEQDKLIEEIANNNPHLFYQITLIKIIYFAECNNSDSQSFEQLVFNSMKNFFNTHKPKPWVMKKTLGRVIKFYQKFEALNIEQNENKIKKGVEILKEIQREFKAGEIYLDLGSFYQKRFARITESNNIIAPVSFRKNNKKLNIIEVKETSDDVPHFYPEDFGDDYRIITPRDLLKSR